MLIIGVSGWAALVDFLLQKFLNLKVLCPLIFYNKIYTYNILTATFSGLTWCKIASIGILCLPVRLFVWGNGNESEQRIFIKNYTVIYYAI